MLNWKQILKLKLKYLEAFIWILVLGILAFSPIHEDHYSLCMFKNLGIGFCPGCGLGHSIIYLFHGQFAKSFHAHPLGILTVVVLIYRIFKIIEINKKYKPL